MKLLFDHNLSPKLVGRLSDVFSECQHVAELGMDRASDKEVWEYARDNGLVIVTKDADFGEFSLIWGTPPQVIWIRRGNCTTSEIETILRENLDIIRDFESENLVGNLTLF